MKKIDNNKYLTLVPDEGYMLVDKEQQIVSECVYAPLDTDVSNWKEILIEDATALLNVWESNN